MLSLPLCSPFPLLLSFFQHSQCGSSLEHHWRSIFSFVACFTVLWFIGQYVVLVVLRSVTFVFLILDFNTFSFLWKTSLKTTCLCDGCFLLKDCFIIIIYYIYSVTYLLTRLLPALSMWLFPRAPLVKHL